LRLFALLCALLPAVALADEAPGPQGALIVHPLTDMAEPAQRRAAMSTLTAAGAGRWEPHHLTLSDELLGDGWIGPAPTEGCTDPTRTPANFAADVAAATEDLQFGRNDRAGLKLAALTGSVSCLQSPVTSAELYQLWFLRGALHHLEGRVDEAKQALLHAAVADRDQPFDESFSPALRDLLVRAKEEVLTRPAAPLIVLTQSEVRVDGTVVSTDQGRGTVLLRAGEHVVQTTVEGQTETRLVHLTGLPLREDTPVLVLADKPTLARALSAMPDEASPDREAARQVLHAWLQANRLPWTLVTLVGPGGGPAEQRVLQISGLDGAVTAYSGRGTRGDAWTRRFRIGAYLGWRAQAAVAEGALPRSYADVTVSGWASLAWILRVGGSVSVAFSGSDVEGTTVVVLPQVAFRLRLESPTGLVRPFGEVGFLVEWPFAPQTIGGHEFGGLLSPVWGLEGWGGVMLVPGRERRVGIQLGLGGGTSTQIGGFLRVRLGAEVRF
jgi:hypothetical protein